jgi:hypothetical protein
MANDDTKRASRFFIDHGTIHDRQTGKHVCCDDINRLDIGESVNLLNEQQAAYDAVVRELARERDEFGAKDTKLLSELAAAKAEIAAIEFSRMNAKIPDSGIVLHVLEKQLTEASAEIERHISEKQYLVNQRNSAEASVQSRDALLDRCEKVLSEIALPWSKDALGKYYEGVASRMLAELKLRKK